MTDAAGRSIRVAVAVDAGGHYLEVADQGVGMTPHVVENYLLAVAGDYWHSDDFHGDFPAVSADKFQPAGRYGIGFLSAFMFGDEVTVDTERAGGGHIRVKLHGLKRRGSLVKKAARGRIGTTITVRVAETDLADYTGLASVVRARTPMLELPITVSLPAGESTIEPGWWQSAGQEELASFVAEWPLLAWHPESKREELRERRASRWTYVGGERYPFASGLAPSNPWCGPHPEASSQTFRVLAAPDRREVVVCSRGIAIGTISLRGVLGLVEVGDVQVDAARATALGLDEGALHGMLLSALRPRIIGALNALAEEDSIPARYAFLNRVGATYGEGVLTATDLPWVTTVEPPGHARLVNATELANIVSGAAEVLIGYGLGPWSACDALRARFPAASKEAVVIPISNAGGPSFGSYSETEDYHFGGLAGHFGSHAPVTDAVLLLAALNTIAGAWGTNLQKLLDANWCRKKTEYVCAHLVKP